MILVKHELINFLHHFGGDYLHLCQYDTYCYMRQMNKIYNIPCVENEISNPEIKNKYTCGAYNFETRCFIKIELPEFDIICTHLDVESHRIRIYQLIELNKYIRKKTIILGDFNLVDKNDFSLENAGNFGVNYLKMRENMSSKFRLTNEEINKIKEFGWKDSFEICNKNPINFSVWSQTRTDFIFFTNEWTRDEIIDTFVYFTNSTDHLPIVCDIKMNFNREKQELNIMQKRILRPFYNITINEFYEDIIDYYESKEYKYDYIQDLSNIYFYNGQSFDVFDWFEFNNNLKVNEKYDFSDPNVTGNSAAANKLGIEGVYLSLNIDSAIGFGEEFNKRKLISGLDNSDMAKYITLFEFKLNENYIDNLNIIKVIGGNRYDKKWDKLYDIASVMSFSTIPYIKITKKLYDNETNCHPIIKLTNIYLLYDLKISYNLLYRSIETENTEYWLKKVDNEKEVFRGYISYCNEQLQNKGKNILPINNIKFAYIGNRLFLVYIIELSDSINPNIIITNELYDIIPILRNVYMKNLQQSGGNINFKYKYNKYKTKYLTLKNNMGGYKKMIM